MIQIFIPSYNRATPSTCHAFTTVQLLELCGIRSYKVVVRPSQYKDYQLCGVRERNLLQLPGEVGLNHAREYTRQFVKRGYWCLQMDDNVRGFIMPERKLYQQYDEIAPGDGEAMITRATWQQRMNVPVSFTEFYKYVVEDTIKQATRRGANLAGFSAHENPAFRARKWADAGYVCGKAFLIRNTGWLPWNQSKGSAGEDYALTAAHLYAHGRVLVNKWGHPLRVHYQPGGCGPYLQRLPEMLAAQQELTQRYGSLFGIKNAKQPGKKQGELRIRFNSPKQVEAWRAQLEESNASPNYLTVGGQ